MIRAADSADGKDFTLLLQFDMGMDGFASDWAYCDRLSSYMAKMVSHNRADSILYSNLLSSALNELLETAFRQHHAGGDLLCSISRSGARDRVELTIPSDGDTSDFYQDAIARLSHAGVAEEYRNALFADGPLTNDIGLMELAVDYGAQLSVEQLGDHSLRLVAEFALEETHSDAQ